MEEAQARRYSTRRRAIVEALATELERIDGQAPFRTSVASVERRLKFWDEVNEFPTIHIGAGTETREYEGGGFRFRFLRITVRCYVSDDNDQNERWRTQSKTAPSIMIPSINQNPVLQKITEQDLLKILSNKSKNIQNNCSRGCSSNRSFFQ